MLYSSVLLALAILTADEDAKQDEPPLQPVANQHELVERIFAAGGDAERVGIYIINVSLRDTTDKDFALLKDLKAVKYFDCAYCKTDGSGLAHIVQMKQLECLWLHNNKFKDKYLKFISDFPRLETLHLQDTTTTDSGIRHVRNLKSLQTLYLSNTNITDMGLIYIRELINLNTLDLSGTKVTSSGLRHVENLKSLERLYLANTNIKDDGLKYLLELSNLKTLDLDDTKVTSEGIEVLKRHLPKTKLFAPSNVDVQER